MRIHWPAVVASGMVASCLAVGGVGVEARQTAKPGEVPPAPRSTASLLSPPSRYPPVLLPGTRPTVLSTIQGNALTETNASMPGSPVRLRDARMGRVVSTTTTDKSGLFVFRTLDPGSYVVEIINDNALVLAASQILSVNAGEAISTIVQLPLRTSSFAALLGPTTTAVSQSVLAAAASTGVLTSGPLGVCVSGPCQ